MAKKIDLEKTAKKVEYISSKVEVILQNKLFVAFFLVVDGITFILNPDTTLEGMAKNIMLLVILAAAGILITNLTAKEKDKKNNFNFGCHLDTRHHFLDLSRLHIWIFAATTGIVYYIRWAVKYSTYPKSEPIGEIYRENSRKIP